MGIGFMAPQSLWLHGQRVKWLAHSSQKSNVLQRNLYIYNKDKLILGFISFMLCHYEKY